MRNVGKGLHKVLKDFVNELSEALPILGESGSEVSYVIPEPRDFAELTRLSEDTQKTWSTETLKYINNIIKNHIFWLMIQKSVSL